MRYSRRTLTVATAAGAALVLAGCTSTSDADGEFALVSEGSLTICTEPTYAPFEFSQDGETVGFDIDIAGEIANDLDLELEILAVSFEGVESGTALDTRQCDLAISGMSINDERAERMTFSQPYFTDGLGLLVADENEFDSVDSLGDEPIAVQSATTGEEFAVEQGLNSIQFESSALAVQALQTGQVVGIVNNLASLGAAADSDDSLSVVEEFQTEELGVAVRLGNTELIDSVNSTLDRIVDDGTYDELVETWIS